MLAFNIISHVYTDALSILLCQVSSMFTSALTAFSFLPYHFFLTYLQSSPNETSSLKPRMAFFSLNLIYSYPFLLFLLKIIDFCSWSSIFSSGLALCHLLLFSCSISIRSIIHFLRMNDAWFSNLCLKLWFLVSFEPSPHSIHLTIWMFQIMNSVCLDWIHNSVSNPSPHPNSSFQRWTFKILHLSSFHRFNQSSNSVSLSIKMSKMYPFILIQTLIASCLSYCHGFSTGQSNFTPCFFCILNTAFSLVF